MANVNIKSGASVSVEYIKQATAPTVSAAGRADGYVTDNADHAVKDYSGVIKPSQQILPGTCQGRLSLTSGTAVTTSDVTAATTIYFTPYKGDQLTLYDGSEKWENYTFTERSLSIAALSASVNYDIFIYDNAGTLTLEAVAWATSTTRATALVKQNGADVKSGATSHLFLATIFMTGVAGQCEDSDAYRGVWNNYNRVPRRLRKVDTSGAGVYSTATYRSWFSSTANRVNFVIGLSEAPVMLKFLASAYVVNAAAAISGIGLDSTTVTSATLTSYLLNDDASNNIIGTSESEYIGYPGIGAHFLQALEKGNGSGTTTWIGNAGIAGVQCGMEGWILA